ncbi:MAG: helix-turn-helix domain-containing protein [Lachnospiraceae bacterium]|nr:helix-turn-helix domain-containing protein [Lachnospiraceae bacterium]
MADEKSILEVRTLGGFEMIYQGKAFQEGRKQTTKAVRMLQTLLHAGSVGVSREQLLENLFGYEVETSGRSPRRFVLSRLKKTLQYIEIRL